MSPAAEALAAQPIVVDFFDSTSHTDAQVIALLVKASKKTYGV